MQRGFLVVVCLLMTSGLGLADDDRPIREKVRDVERHMRQIIDTAEPSVVAVVVSNNPRYPALHASERTTPGRLGDYPVAQEGFGRGFRGLPAVDPKLDLTNWQNVADNQFGSGVVLDSDGLILTNYHLVEGAKKIYVKNGLWREATVGGKPRESRGTIGIIATGSAAFRGSGKPVMVVETATCQGGEIA